MIKVKFTFNGIDTIIECKKEGKMKDIIYKYVNSMGYDINLIYFLYNGMQLDLDFDLNQLKEDKNEINILVNEKSKSTEITDNGIIKSKEIICLR